MTRDELEQDRAALQRKIEARKDMPGYAANVEAIKAKIEQIDAELVELNE